MGKKAPENRSPQHPTVHHLPHQDAHLEEDFGLPSGKHTKNDGKPPFFMGKSTINVHLQ